MAWYSLFGKSKIKIVFEKMPSVDIRNKVKAAHYIWDPDGRYWKADFSDETLAVAKEVCGETANPNEINKNVAMLAPVEGVLHKNYGLKVKLKDIISADDAKLAECVDCLKDYVEEVNRENGHPDEKAKDSQIRSWQDCFKFIKDNLVNLSKSKQDFEFIFEYSLPGTAHERPDVFLLTEKRVISLEFKRKETPQIDGNKDDVAQAIRYKEYLQNHHAVTRDKNLEVKSYLVCTGDIAASGQLRGIDVLTKDNFCSVIEEELEDAKCCSFSKDWLESSRTEMPDMLQAIYQMYCDGTIPYISDVNQNCLEKVRGYISDARNNHKKVLILINGVPGAGKTAVGQSIVFEENRNLEANAVYISGNGPLVEVLRHQINNAGNNKNMAENAIQNMKGFKSYFKDHTQLPKDLSIIVFDEAQRAWPEEPKGLLSVCDRICENKGYAVLIGLYGNGQVIYKGEEAGLSSWEEALREHHGWAVISSDSIANHFNDIGNTEKLVDDATECVLLLLREI